jgi:hypothetical protein
MSRAQHSAPPQNLWSRWEGAKMDHLCGGEEEEARARWIGWRTSRRRPARSRRLRHPLRSNLQCAPLKSPCAARAVPTRSTAGRVLRAGRGQAILSYLKIIANPRDEAAFLRVVTCPARHRWTRAAPRHEICRTEGKSLACAGRNAGARLAAPKRGSWAARFLSNLATPETLP